MLPKEVVVVETSCLNLLETKESAVQPIVGRCHPQSLTVAMPNWCVHYATIRSKGFVYTIRHLVEGRMGSPTMGNMYNGMYDSNSPTSQWRGVVDRGVGCWLQMVTKSATKVSSSMLAAHCPRGADHDEWTKPMSLKRNN